MPQTKNNGTIQFRKFDGSTEEHSHGRVFRTIVAVAVLAVAMGMLTVKYVVLPLRTGHMPELKVMEVILQGVLMVVGVIMIDTKTGFALLQDLLKGLKK